MPKKTNYKIICICQVYNEIEKGNLKRFFEYTKPLVNDIIIYDDGSTDGSFEYALDQTPYVIRGAKNSFKDEISHRQMMLEKAKALKADFILWLDADEVLSNSTKAKLQELCNFCVSNNYDGIALHELNIWRSSTWRRIDSLFDDGWFNRIWRVTPELSFGEIKQGLHQDLFPPTIKKVYQTDKISVLHYGFSNELNLSFKYLTYRKHGQKGYEMLDRLISEEKLKLEKIPNELFPDGLWKDQEAKPTPLEFFESLAYVYKHEQIVYRPKYSIACLIYKSTDWLKFAYDQVLKNTDLSDKEFFFVANDADEDVLKYLKDNYIPHYILNNIAEQRKEWYINNVYRGYNYAAQKAKGDFIIFINSDMAFTPNWLDNLIRSYNGSNCVASRLVESGKLEVGDNGIEKDFGKKINEFKEEEFLKYAQIVKDDKTINNGLYMPLLVRKDQFIKIGGYPEGNIKKNTKDIFNPEIAKQGEELISGDKILIKKLASIGVKHHTAFGSIVYHFQCGEKDDVREIDNNQELINIAICNDLVTGTMGEKVLWDYMIENLPGAYGIDKRITGEENYEENARRYITTDHINTKIVIQNATFIGPIAKDIHTIAFLQDDLRSMGRQSCQQELNLKLANKIVTNSFQTASVYRDYPCEIIPVGLDSELFQPKDKNLLRKKHKLSNKKTGIFVGDFSEVKGWSKVKSCIEKHDEIQWILVTKKEEDYKRNNARVYSRIDQYLLSELLNCADFFIIGSPVETQCLAAIEACLCDVPVIMHNVGLFKDLSVQEKAKVGIICDNFNKAIDEISTKKFFPRNIMINRKLTVKDSMEKWNKLLSDSIGTIQIEKDFEGKNKNKFSNFSFELEFYFRKKILKRLFGHEHLQIRKYFSKNFILFLIINILTRLNLLSTIKKILGRT